MYALHQIRLTRKTTLFLDSRHETAWCYGKCGKHVTLYADVTKLTLNDVLVDPVNLHAVALPASKTGVPGMWWRGQLGWGVGPP